MTNRDAALWMLVCALAMSPGAAREDVNAEDLSAEQVLDCGLHTRFDTEFAQVIDVQTRRNGMSLRRYQLQIATKRIASLTRFLAIFVAPEDQRGMKLLTIENQNRRNDHFLFMPFLGKVKRIYGGRRQEAFLGTEFSFEDMEAVEASDFDAEIVGLEELGGRRHRVVAAVPRFESGYARSEYLIDQRDCQISEIRHYKRGAERPFKVISIPRESLLEVEGVLMPTLAIARNIETETETEVRFSSIDVAPDLDGHFFEPSTLERLKGLPGLPKSAGAE